MTEQVDRYEDMATCMKFVNEQWVKDRNIPSSAYKNLIETSNSSWSIILRIKQKTEGAKKQVIREYRKKMQWPRQEILHWHTVSTGKVLDP